MLKQQYGPSPEHIKMEFVNQNLQVECQTWNHYQTEYKKTKEKLLKKKSEEIKSRSVRNSVPLLVVSDAVRSPLMSSGTGPLLSTGVLDLENITILSITPEKGNAVF